MMFQSYALFPHMTVEKNIAFGLEMEKLPKGEITARVEEMLKLVKLEGFALRKPHQLSGGQRQRVSIARALANWPQIIIADEPTGNLDQANGQNVIEHLTKLNRELNITLILITHDANVAKKAPRILEIVDGNVTDRKSA
jgi:putrescine transport system ATP-binding protein